MFNISRNTLDQWIKHRQATGSFEPIQREHNGPRPKIDDLEEFRTFAQTNGHLTQKEMAQLWPEPVSTYVISNALHRIGFTRKKKPMATANVTNSYANHS